MAVPGKLSSHLDEQWETIDEKFPITFDRNAPENQEKLQKIHTQMEAFFKENNILDQYHCNNSHALNAAKWLLTLCARLQPEENTQRYITLLQHPNTKVQAAALIAMPFSDAYCKNPDIQNAVKDVFRKAPVSSVSPEGKGSSDTRVSFIHILETSLKMGLEDTPDLLRDTIRNAQKENADNPKEIDELQGSVKSYISYIAEELTDASRAFVANQPAWAEKTMRVAHQSLEVIRELYPEMSKEIEKQTQSVKNMVQLSPIGVVLPDPLHPKPDDTPTPRAEDISATADALKKETDEPAL